MSRGNVMNTDIEITGSFEDVLAGHSVQGGHQTNTWSRTNLPGYSKGAHNINFQNIDISSSRHESGASEIHLFGLTKTGHSILARVTEFEHYLFFAAPVGFLEGDVDPLRSYLNIFKSQKCQYRNFAFSDKVIPAFTDQTSDTYPRRFMNHTGIKAMSWSILNTNKYEVVPAGKKISHCQMEVLIKIDHIVTCDPNIEQGHAPFRILSFDIETDVPAKGFPNALNQPIIQIGNMVSVYGRPSPFIRTIFTLGTCSPMEGAQVLSFDNEHDMLMAWRNFVIDVDPDIITGFHINKFDITYLLDRSTTLDLPDFPFLGRHKYFRQHSCPGVEDPWYNCPGFDGRLLLDIFYHTYHYHEGQYRGIGKGTLNAVSADSLKEQKEDLHYTQIPILYRGNADDRRRLGVYCLKDVYLPLRLFFKLQCLEIEMLTARWYDVPLSAVRRNRLMTNEIFEAAE